MTEETGKFKFYTEEEIIEMSSDIRLAQRRINKSMQISRLTHAIKVIVDKLGCENEKGIKRAEQRGEMFENSSLYDAYLIAKFERDAARKKLGELPSVPALASKQLLFFL